MFNRVTDFPFFVCDALLVLQEVLQFGVGLYALQLVGDNLPDLGTDAVVVLLNHLLHAVVAAGGCNYLPSSNGTAFVHWLQQSALLVPVLFPNRPLE